MNLVLCTWSLGTSPNPEASPAVSVKQTCEILVPVPAERWMVKEVAFAGAVSETVSLAAPEIV